MITKEKFIKAMKQIEKVDNFWNEQNDLYRKYSDILLDGIAPIPLITDTIVELLEENLGIAQDLRGYSTLSWWIYEAEFGQKEDFINSLEYTDESGKQMEPPCKPTTIEDLYDLLVWESTVFRKEVKE